MVKFALVSRLGGELQRIMLSSVEKCLQYPVASGGQCSAVQAKNDALKEAGAVVPDSFEAFEGAIKETYDRLVADGKLVPQPDTPAPSVPLDLEAAKKAGKVGGSCWTRLSVSTV